MFAPSPQLHLPFWRVTAGVLALALALTAPASAKKLKAEVVQPQYRQALETLAGGDREGAVDQLVGMENRLLGAEPTQREVERLWRLKLRVIRVLLEQGQLDIMAPIVMLHHDAYLAYRAQPHPILAVHSRNMAAELGEIFADRMGTRDAKRFASAVLTSLGSYSQAGWATLESKDQFDRALALVPDNEAALLGSAAIYEKYGEYDNAIELLQRAVGTKRGSPESSLRLGVCQARADDLQGARNSLSGVLAMDSPAWVRAVAYQELARVYQQLGQQGRAEVVLRRGLEELPANQQISIQLASLLDQQRRLSEVMALISGVQPEESESASARYLYGKWPSELVGGVRQQFMEHGESKLALLRSILDQVGADQVVTG